MVSCQSDHDSPHITLSLYKSDFHHLVMLKSYHSQFVLMCLLAEHPVQVRQGSGNGLCIHIGKTICYLILQLHLEWNKNGFYIIVYAFLCVPGCRYYPGSIRPGCEMLVLVAIRRRHGFCSIQVA